MKKLTTLTTAGLLSAVIFVQKQMSKKTKPFQVAIPPQK